MIRATTISILTCSFIATIIFNLGANQPPLPLFCQDQQADVLLFSAIKKHNLALVVQALNEGADINALDSSTNYPNTPLMVALEELHTKLVNTHQTKRAILGASLVTGLVSTPFIMPYAQDTHCYKYISAQHPRTCDIATSAATALSIGTLSNTLLNKAFTNSSTAQITNAYLIVKLLLEQPAINLTYINTVTGITAHQMVGSYLLNIPIMTSHCHPWHISGINTTFATKLLALAAIIGLDAAMHAVDEYLLKNKIECVFLPLAHEIGQRILHTVKLN